ncbi:hypothetical protein A2495_00340 [Candidatus Curtissbacteria bacterium RIFOXYC12_FULL_41_11]|nr:MAG: hypothetical protein A2495_00340 [Candidatus Curtissbacteria bacterium RIFOXYC12_FULL_41_11]
MRHYYNGGVWVQVRAATAYASINVTGGGGASPTPGASPSPSSPPGAINITSATANCNADGYPNVRLTWTSGTGDSNYIIGRWPAYAEGGEKNGYNSPFNSTYNFTVGFNETSYWVVKSNINQSIEDGEWVTTPSSCGGPQPTSTPPAGLPDLQVVSVTMNKANYYPGEQLDASIVVRNNGGDVVNSYGSDYFWLFDYLNRASKPPCNSGLSDGDSRGNEHLAPGETKTYHSGSRVSMTPGNYTFGSFIDDECIVSETTEANNWKTAPYTVSGSPKTDVNVTIFFDKNSNGRKDADEQFASGGNPNWNSSIGSLTVNGTPFTTIVANGTGLTNDAATSGQLVNARLSLAAGWSGTLWSYTFNDCTGPSCVPVSWEEDLAYTSPNFTALTPAVPAGFDTSDSVLFMFGINQGPPSAPANLSATASCTVTYQPQIAFSWTASTGANEYYLDVTTDSAWSSWSFAHVTPGTATSFLWDAAHALTPGGGSTLTVPAINTQYYWRLLARNASGDSPHVYPFNNLTSPGDIGSNPPDVTKVPVTTPNCVPPDIDWNDLGVSIELFKDNWTVPGNSFEEGENIYVRVNVNNLINNGGDSPGFNVGFYLNPGTEPNCSDSPDEQMNIGPLGAGGSPSLPSWDFVATAPTAGTDASKTAYAFADWQCAVVESDEDNNIAPKFYTIDVDAWFETIGGDVGSSGSGGITLNMLPLPPTPRYQSTYLLGSVESQLNVASEKDWVIRNYKDTNGIPKRLIPSGTVYDYLASRFLDGAKTSDTDQGCALANVQAGLNYCNGPMTIDGGTWIGGHAVLFIEGNLTVAAGTTGEFTVGPTDTITFVVADGDSDVDDITINTDVTRADGIYIAGGDFTDTDASGIFGPQLTINGAVYANEVKLTRVLSGNPLVCGTICDNSQDPAEIITFQLKYLVALAGDDYLGSPAISWREVAP